MKKMRRGDHEIALKRPEERTTWDLLQVFFATVQYGSYKKAADHLLISPQSVHDLESRLSQKIIHFLPKNNMEMERYPAPLMTSEGAKWYLVVSELTNKENIEERLSYFKRESMMPFGFEPIAYNIWQLSQRQAPKSQDEEPTFCMIKLLLKEDHIMKEFKILTTDSLANYVLDSILAKLFFQYPDIKFSIIDATIDREPEVDLFFLHYDHKFDHFISEKLIQGKFHLYANSNYLEKKGIPKTMDDLLGHNIIRPNRADVSLKFGVEKFGTAEYYKPIHHKKDAILVDTMTSLYKLGEMGAGIICTSDVEAKQANLNLEQLPELQENAYVDHTLGFHEKHKNSQIVKDLRRELKSVLLS